MCFVSSFWLGDYQVWYRTDVASLVGNGDLKFSDCSHVLIHFNGGFRFILLDLYS